MPAPLQYPLINGYEYSYASVEMNISGIGVFAPLPSVKSISYKEALTSATIYGNSPFPQGRTRGQIKGTGSIEFYRRQWDAVAAILSGGGLWGFSEKSYVINVSYAEAGAPMIMDVLQQVRFHSPDLTNSEGTEALTVKCELDILKPILWSGASALSMSPLFTV